MRGRTCIWGLTLVIVLVALFWMSTAGAETTVCTEITTAPYTISTQGIYCLNGNLEANIASGNAIEITVNNVVIDLNGHKIGNLAAGPTTTAIGIYAYQRQNITIRNGTIRGFEYGIYLSDPSPYTTSQGHIIEDIRADLNTNSGIRVYGRGNIIRNNIVVSTGRTDLTNSHAYGISVAGPGNRVINNDVYETKEHGMGNANGIYGELCDGAVIDNNRVGNAAFGTGTSLGIFLVSANDVLLTNNKITRINYGIFFGVSTGAYMNSLVYGATTAFTGGTAAGSTNYAY